MGHRPPNRGPSFGRTSDVDAVRERLAEPGVVVVTGPPGIGKTLLVAEIAEAWPEEVVWVDLEGASDEAGARVASALRIGAAAVGAALRSRGRALLVLDDAEGAAAVLPELLVAWTGEAPDLRVLASSRIRLDGAVIWPLGPLDADAAASLYLDRASAVQPGVALDRTAVVDLVEALDRLPLALELAAARVRLFPPETLTERLPGVLADRRRSGRHGSLEAALTVSWELLSEDQRGGLAAASVLHGPFDAAAFERVTACDPEVLEALLDASLVNPAGAGWVRLLETVRGFVSARLEPDRRQELELRHTSWALEAGRSAARIARADGDWTRVQGLRADLREVVRRGGPEAVHAALVLGDLALAAGPRVDPTRGLGPIPAALRVRVACLRANFLLDAARSEEALILLADAGPPNDATERLLLAQHRMIHLRHLNRRDEALLALAEADEAAPDADPFEVANLRIAEAVLHTWRSEPDRAIAALEAGRRAIAPTPSRVLDARLLAYLGGVLSQGTESRPLGITHLEHALALFRQLGDRGWEGVVLVWLGGTMFDLGRLDLAAGHLAEAAVACARCGDTRFEAQALEHLAGVRIEQRQWDEVRALHERIRALPPRASILSLLQGQEGLVAHFSGRTADARNHYEGAVAGFTAQGHRKLRVTYQVFQALVDPEHADALLKDSGLEEHFPLLLRIAGEAIRGEPSEEALALARRTERADVRILLALTDRGARVAIDGAWFEPRGGARVGLERRPVLQRALAALAVAGPGTLVRRDDLIAAAWPGERMTPASADARLHATIRALRRLGLEQVLWTGEIVGDLGYGLARDVLVLR